MILVQFALLLLGLASHHVVNVASFSTPEVIARHRDVLTTNVPKVHFVEESQSIYQRVRTIVYMGKQEEDITTESKLDDILGSVGAISQPVVWVSLYFVATTGGGLPAGPFGLLGALEGLSPSLA